MFLKRLSPRTLLSLTPSSWPSPYSIFIAKCSTSSPSHLTHSHAHSLPDSRNVGVSVCWDIDNCTVPLGVNASRVDKAITAAIESSGIKGPIQITAFGDMSLVARTTLDALSSTEITLRCVPHAEPDRAARTLSLHLTLELMLWASQNPPPVHLFLISGNAGFSEILHLLRMRNYNILLASKEPVNCFLRSAATIMWNWDALVREENLSRRYFNQPPSSWYGHHEGPLEDPYTALERPET